MINNNEQDRIDMAEEISEIRLSGKVNMYDRKEVINELFALGYDYTAEYLEENKEDYINLLKLRGEEYQRHVIRQLKEEFK